MFAATAKIMQNHVKSRHRTLQIFKVNILGCFASGFGAKMFV